MNPLPLQGLPQQQKTASDDCGQDYYRSTLHLPAQKYRHHADDRRDDDSTRDKLLEGYERDMAEAAARKAKRVDGIAAE